MATWMVHLRIADGIMKEIPKLERQEFIMGNIAPDSGVPNEDWSVFTPNTNVSHFKKDGEITIPLFRDKYMNKELWEGYSDKEKSFFLGYYIHLLTDVLWKEKITDPSMQRFSELFGKDKDAIWKLKEDWYDLIQLLPSSYNQMRTCTMNYETLVNIYFARRNHKLQEWHTFCHWIESLPYAKELIIAQEEE